MVVALSPGWDRGRSRSPHTAAWEAANPMPLASLSQDVEAAPVCVHDPGHRYLMAARMLLLCAVLRLWGADAALWAQDRPTQIHINQGDRDGTAVTFSWVTESDAASTVLLGTQSGLYVDHVDPTPAARYSYTSHNGPYTSGLIHHVTVPHLTPSTKYFYRCGSHTGVLSAEHSFRTPPPPSAAAKVSFAIVGDLGQTKYSKQNMEDMLADAPEALVIVGDLSYADSGDESTDDRPCGQDRWDSWFQMMQPLFSNTLIMTLPGNHEMEIAGTQPQFLAYTSRLRMPSQQQLFYSYNYGSVHMVMLNSYMPFAHGTPQHDFLRADLAAVDRKVTPWLVVACHAPWYNSNRAHENEAEEVLMRRAMEDLLYNHSVDLVFAGHVHNYERTHPVYRNRTDHGGPVYITVGDGGNREGVAKEWNRAPEWSAFRLDKEQDPSRVFGHGKMTAHNATHLHFHWRSLPKATHRLSDSLWLVKGEALDAPRIISFPG